MQTINGYDGPNSHVTKFIDVWHFQHLNIFYDIWRLAALEKTANK